MAVTTGYVQRITLSQGPLACVWVGSAPNATELLLIQVMPGDSAATRTAKRMLAAVLVDAQVTGRAVDVSHPDNSSTVTGVDLPAGNVTQTPVQMDAIETTQAIQDLAQSVPLVAGKRTVVRVYLSKYSPGALTVRGELSVRQSPIDPPVVIPSVNTVTLDPAQAGNSAVKRNDVTRSLNFVLAPPQTAEGSLSIRLSSLTEVGSNNPVAVGGERRPVVSFQRSAPLRVRIIGMRYQQGTPAVTHIPSNLDFALLLSWLARAYPVGQVLSTQVLVTATATPPFLCGDINAQVAAIRALDVDGGVDARTHYYGFVSDGGFFMRGCAAIPATPDPAAISSGPTGPGSWGWDFDGSYGDWYGGHELGHTYGRRHPGFCGESMSDPSYPFAAGQLSPSDAGFCGLDVGDPANGLPIAALPGTQWHDVMTYCDRQWLSVYTYLGIRMRLLAEDALPAQAGAVMGGAGAGAGGFAAGGRPDERYPQPQPQPRRAAEEEPAGRESARPQAEIRISVVATVNLTTRQGKIEFVNPVTNVAATSADPGSRVVLRVLEADGTGVAEHAVAAKLNSELGPDDDEVGVVDAVIAVPASARVIELVIGGQVADTFRASGPPPVVRAVRSIDANAAEVRLAVDVDRALEETHTFAVQVSSDGGRIWQTVGVGLKEPLLTVDRTQFPEGRRLQFRVLASNGFESSVLTTDPIGT